MTLYEYCGNAMLLDAGSNAWTEETQDWPTVVVQHAGGSQRVYSFPTIEHARAAARNIEMLLAERTER